MTPSANTPPSSSGHDTQADFRADMDLLNQEDVPTESGKEELPPDIEEETEDEPEGEETPEVEEKEEEEETEEIEEEDKGEEKTEDNVRPIHSRPTIRQITAKYPSFFKDFPDMRHMLFREAEYSRVFPTVEDARSAADNSQNFERLSDLVTSGKSEDFKEFLSGIKEVNGLRSMAVNFLPALYSQDQQLYFKITTPIAEQLIRNAYAAAKQAGNENLLNSALHMAQWAFNDTGFATGEKRSEPLTATDKPKDPELERERSEFYQTKYQDTRTYVQSNAHNRLVAEVKRGLDPNNVLTPTLRELLVKEILSEVGSVLEADERHMGVMNSLWKNARKAGFAGDWKDRILSTYLSRARQVMPAIRQRIRDGALKTEQRKSESIERRGQKSVDRREVQGSQNPNTKGHNGRPPAAREIDWGKTSDMDLLEDRVTLKKR